MRLDTGLVQHPPSAWIVAEVPSLRIVPEALWQAAEARVLKAMEEHLWNEDLFEEFCTEFTRARKGVAH